MPTLSRLYKIDKSRQKTATTPRRRSRAPDLSCLLSAEERRLHAQIPKNIDYVPHPCFTRKDTEEKLFGQGSKVDVPEWVYFAEVVDEIPPRMSRRTALSPEDEATLFLRYNYARYRLSKLTEESRRRRTLARARQTIQWFRSAMKARSDLVQANIALVLAMAKRTRIPNVEFAELVCEGNMALLRSVEKFDVSRGFKFSTYACRSILKSFSRLAITTARYRRRFPMEFDPDLQRSDNDVHKHEMQRKDSIGALREILTYNRAKLTEVERMIVCERFAIYSRGKGRTLAEVGKMVGLTNERVRQIQNLALRKIRSALDEQFLAP